jgi:hypothetical protein
MYGSMSADEIKLQQNSTMAHIFLNKNSKKVYNIFNSTVKAYIPLLLTIYLDYRIIEFVYKNKMKRKRTTAKTKADTKSRVSIMLITIVSVFAFCMVPDSILTMMNLGYANESYLVRAIREITDLLLAINSASTFPICLYFSTQFRNKLNEILMLDTIVKPKENRSNFTTRNNRTVVQEEDEEDELQVTCTNGEVQEDYRFGSVSKAINAPLRKEKSVSIPLRKLKI